MWALELDSSPDYSRVDLWISPPPPHPLLLTVLHVCRWWFSVTACSSWWTRMWWKRPSSTSGWRLWGSWAQSPRWWLASWWRVLLRQGRWWVAQRGERVRDGAQYASVHVPCVEYEPMASWAVILYFFIFALFPPVFSSFLLLNFFSARAIISWSCVGNIYIYIFIFRKWCWKINAVGKICSCSISES